jgi:hypothetical protein
MTVLASAAVLCLAWFAALNAVLSLAAWAACRRAVRGVSVDPRRARALVLLRLFPSAAAAAIAVLMFLPAHVRLEPVDADEAFGAVVLALAATGFLLLVVAAGRLRAVAAGSIRLMRCARVPAGARRPIAELPVFAGVALAGVLRPRVVIGAAARRALSPAELDAAVAHELAHRRSRDNLTRTLMFCVPDLFRLTPAAARLERLWAAEAECLADARAAAGDPERAAALASALIKVARVAAVGRDRMGSLGWSTFHQPDLLAIRVRRLVGATAPARPRHTRPTGISLIAALIVAAAWFAGLPDRLHWLTEIVVARGW